MPPNDAALIAAVEARDAETLVRLYRDRADECAAAGDTDAACFYLTHAYVWALEAGHADTKTLHARLKAEGREQ